jgi:membrane protease YdiL (CAAX protease family)
VRLIATEAKYVAGKSKSAKVAPLWHSLGLLLLLLSISLGFYNAQSASPTEHSLGEPTQGNAGLYLAIIASEWGLCLYIWLGSRCKGAIPVRDLIGGRWSNMKSVLLDIAVAAGFWLVWSAVAMAVGFLEGPSHAEAAAFLNPRGPVEVTLWVIMSVTAGFCEELVYRGYLQKQILAVTGSATLAVMVQAIIFGAGHWYQESKKVIIIAVLGALFGLLAHWRKSLRPGMLSHAWEDVLNVIPVHFP